MNVVERVGVRLAACNAREVKVGNANGGAIGFIVVLCDDGGFA